MKLHLPGRAWTAALALTLALDEGSAAAQPAPGPTPAPPPAAALPGAPAAPPTHGQPPPGYGQAPPGYGPPPAGYYPPPGYGQPPPGYGQPPPGYYPPPAYYYPPPTAMMPVLTLPYEDGDPIPQGFTVRSRANKSLVIAGSITFGVPYILSVLTAGTTLSADASNGAEFAPLFVPVLGPFITIGTAHAEGAGTFWLVVDGLAQTGGMAMFIAGLVLEEKYLQRTMQASLKPEVLINPGGMNLKWRF